MTKKNPKVAVVGATGVVGQEMLRVLHQRQFPASEVVAVASERSAGKKLPFGDRELTVKAIKPEVFEGIDIALFSAGGGTSKEWSPIASAKGAVVIDNSSAWRMDPECPLVVPECNMEAAENRPKGIIANPNCSTIQMVVALKPLHEAAKLERVIVSTYQAVSGAGHEAVTALRAQERAAVDGKQADEKPLKGRLAGNVLMHWSLSKDNPDYQEEELKMVNETRKILGDDSIQVSPTAVRVPVEVGHAESLTLVTQRPLRAKEARELLASAPGIQLVDDFAHGVYPTPLDVVGKDPVLVGRIRQDVGNPDGIQLWVVGDNLRKGAALNAVQIAEGLIA